MTRLTYIPKEGFACPGDGWPASDHEEPDKELAVRKVKSGWYRNEKPVADPKSPTSGSGKEGVK